MSTSGPGAKQHLIKSDGYLEALGGFFISVGFYLVSPHYYLQLHNPAGMFSIAIGWCLFAAIRNRCHMSGHPRFMCMLLFYNSEKGIIHP